MMTGKPAVHSAHTVEDRIRTIRGQKVILDRDLAALYGVPTFRFNEAVKRNHRRFPDDFAFQLTHQELADLISQNAMSSSGHGGVRKPAWAFTEHGAVMAANRTGQPVSPALKWGRFSLLRLRKEIWQSGLC